MFQRSLSRLMHDIRQRRQASRVSKSEKRSASSGSRSRAQRPGSSGSSSRPGTSGSQVEGSLELRRCGLAGDVAHVFVKDEKKFYVHKRVACKSTDFFEAPAEGCDSFRLPDVDEGIFNTYVVWLYTRTVDFSDSDERGRSQSRAEEPTQLSLDTSDHRAIDCFALGHLTRDSAFRNAVIDRLMDIGHVRVAPPSLGVIKHICDKLADDDKLASVFVDYYIALCKPSEHEAMLADAGALAFRKAVASAVQRHRPLLQRLHHPDYKGCGNYHEGGTSAA